MKIIVDAFGGDNAPKAIVEGSLLAKQEFGVDIMLCGKEEDILACAKENGFDLTGVEIRTAESVFPMEEDPMKIRTTYKNSSLGVAFQALAAGEGDALVSAGSTGAVAVGCNVFIKRIKGVKRVAIGIIMPHNEGNFMLIDTGANVSCTPEHLHIFALMGNIYMKQIMGVENPRVGLANIGVEPNKGTELQKEAYKLMEATDAYNFVGNAEVRDVPFGGVDVLVSDGFTGNVFLKTYEGAAMMLMKNISAIFKKNAITKAAALMVMGGIKELKGKMDYNSVGGAPIIGVRKPVIKSHGSAKAETFKNAIKQAMDFAASGAIETIAEQMPKKAQTEEGVTDEA